MCYRNGSKLMPLDVLIETKMPVILDLADPGFFLQLDGLLRGLLGDWG